MHENGVRRGSVQDAADTSGADSRFMSKESHPRGKGQGATGKGWVGEVLGIAMENIHTGLVHRGK